MDIACLWQREESVNSDGDLCDYYKSKIHLDVGWSLLLPITTGQ